MGGTSPGPLTRRSRSNSIWLHGEGRWEDTRTLRRRGNIYRHKKEYEKVLALFEKMAEIQPDDAGADYNMACILALMGKKEEALDALERAVKKGYRNRKWMETDGELSSLRGHTGR